MAMTTAMTTRKLGPRNTHSQSFNCRRFGGVDGVGLLGGKGAARCGGGGALGETGAAGESEMCRDVEGSGDASRSGGTNWLGAMLCVHFHLVVRDVHPPDHV
jgi:hypothetical protein